MTKRRRIQLLLLLSVLIACLWLPDLVKAEWVEDMYGGEVWHWTQATADLDADVAQGALILKYADSSYVQPMHVQWPFSCAHNSLATILRAMGFSRPDTSLWLPADVDDPPGSAEPMVDVRYPGSEEHLMYLWLRRQRLHPRYRYWSAKDSLLISLDGVLNTRYPDAWLSRYSSSDWGQKTANFMNYVLCQELGCGALDARRWGGPDPADASDMIAYRRIIKGFIDHDIPLLLQVMNTKHFNVIIGYRGRVEDAEQPFYVYTTETNRESWRRIDASGTSIAAGMMSRIVFWNHHLNGGCEPGGWAWQVDQDNGNALLCGYTVDPEDPLVLPEGVSNVASVNLDRNDGRLSTTSDGLYGVFASARGTAQGHIFQVRRDAVACEWESIELIEELVGPVGDFEPCIRADGLELCFASKRPGGLGGPDIWRSTRATRQDTWSEPEPIAEINSKWGEAGPCLSVDGKRIYFHSGRSGGGDIFVAERNTSSGLFGPPVSVMSLNTSAGEFVPCVSPDEKTIYFASNRSGGEGNVDIWMATRSSRHADWSNVTNLSVINTAGREFSPWFEAATGLVYFEAERQIGWGNKDIYVWDPHFIKGDINKDRKVEMADFALLARDWMRSSPASNLIGGEDIVDIYDMQVLAENWLEHARCPCHKNGL